MAKSDKGGYEVGFGKPPRSRRFKPGQSGNPAGRPPAAKNFATALEQELKRRVIITENGKRKKISKREVIAKHLVNKAAGGDLKAIPLLLNETRAHDSETAAGPDQVFGTPEDRTVLETIVARIRSSSPEGVPTPPAPQESAPTRFRRRERSQE